MIKKSHVLITPSGFTEKALHKLNDEKLKDRVKIIASGELPEVAEPGIIYVVRVKTLPHKVFVGLMAYSMRVGLVPIGAGDGFMSAAINLGGPFILTRVTWNRKNIENLYKRLLISLSRTESPLSREERYAGVKLVEEILQKGDFIRAQELKKITWSYEVISHSVPSLTTSIMTAAVLARESSSWQAEDYFRIKNLDHIRDKELVTSLAFGGVEEQLAAASRWTSYINDIKKKSLEKWNLLMRIGAPKNTNAEIQKLSLIQRLMNLFIRNNIVEDQSKKTEVKEVLPKVENINSCQRLFT